MHLPQNQINNIITDLVCIFYHIMINTLMCDVHGMKTDKIRRCLTEASLFYYMHQTIVLTS